MTDLALRLVAEREKLQCTTEEFAEQLGIPRDDLVSILEGEIPLHPSVYILAAKYLTAEKKAKEYLEEIEASKRAREAKERKRKKYIVFPTPDK